MPYTSIIVVEDGTGVASANSYIEQDFADDYFALYGNADWSGDDAAKELALIKAAQSLDLLYGPRYASTPASSTQQLLWPRASFYDRNANLRSTAAIPVELQRAQAELALLILTEAVDLVPLPNTQSNIEEESQSVGPLSVSYKYRGVAETESFEGYRKIDLLLWPILRSTSGTLVLHR